MIRMKNKRLAAAKAFLVLAIMSAVISGLMIYGEYSFYKQQPDMIESFLPGAIREALPCLLIAIVLTFCAIFFKHLSDKDRAKAIKENDLKQEKILFDGKCD